MKSTLVLGFRIMVSVKVIERNKIVESRNLQIMSVIASNLSIDRSNSDIFFIRKINCLFQNYLSLILEFL